MSFDAHKNFAYSTVATAPSPATSGTSLVVSSGDGAKFPATPFNATIWPIGVQPTTTNAEIVRVTNISTDTLTLTRAQESSTARSVTIGDQIAATITAKSLTDIESATGGGSVGLTGQIDTPPTSPDSNNQEFTGGTSLPGALTIAVSSGSLTNATLTTPLSASPTNPTYNVNQDSVSCIVMQPQASGTMKLYLTFAPTSATNWAYLVKVDGFNTLDTDDRVHVGLTKSGATITSADEPDNSVWLELAIETGWQVADYSKNSGILTGRENSHNWQNSGAYLMFIGATDNSITGYVSADGLTWFLQRKWTGQQINGAVGFAWVSVSDGVGTNPAFGCRLDFLRFLEGNANPYKLHG